jgi:integrase
MSAQHVYKEPHGYVYRRRIPSSLQAAYTSHTGLVTPQFKRSLATHNLQEANKSAIAIADEYDALIANLGRSGHVSEAEKDIMRTLIGFVHLPIPRSTKITHETLKKYYDKYLPMFENCKKKVAESQDLEEPIIKADKLLFDEKMISLEQEYKGLEKICTILEICLKRFENPDYDMIEEEKVIKLMLAKKGLIGIIPNSSPMINSSIPAKITSPVKNCPNLSRALQTWKQQKNPSQSSINEWEYIIKRFIELHGDLPVNQISDNHIIIFRDTMRLLPPLRSPELKQMHINELCKMQKQGKFASEKSISNDTIIKMIGGLKAILQVMVCEGYIERNPATNKSPKSSDNSKNRPPYETHELVKIFTSKLYEKPFSKNAIAKEHAYRFWSPLLALYTGCRAGEIAQLRISDIKQEKCQESGGDIYYISINTIDAGKHIKSGNARRNIPIHDALIKMGFLTYVNKVKKAGHTQLFPEITLDKKSKPSTLISNWYGRYSKMLGVQNEGKSFHSFRDNFRDACVNSMMNETEIYRLMGHAIGGAKNHYGNGLFISNTKKMIDRFYIKELDMRHLYE